ncbi:alpha/beta hydrolase [Pedobacter psychroterrae]|uniref:Alpha/beta hydrolase n=1 Tax=Pedobacter psychroterrae TaxID=2530453 RepID=A0A4R0NLQ6_9SPHI|nr:alpha/beta hydrolase [Pedobacter psychroterrae]TCD01576.1 alpha/beta hydrolase [Pedobacter psychroterrae]
MIRVLFFMLMISGGYCKAQREIALYAGKIPNSKIAKNEESSAPNAEVDSLTFKVSVPTLTVFLPAKGTAIGTSVIICPGGGYHVLLTKREGNDVARAFAKLGVTAFVLKYRLPSDVTMQDKSIGPLQDAQHAIKIVRQNSKKWGIDPAKIGVMGFSAGGHLASSAGTHFSDVRIENNENVSVRPDFMLLINPVVSFTNKIGHIGSRDNLLGASPLQDKIDFFSGELQVTDQTPPAFLVHAGTDHVVPVSNSLGFYQALKMHNIPAGLHIYAKGEHGFLTAPSFEEWFGRCTFWMKSMSFL